MTYGPKTPKPKDADKLREHAKHHTKTHIKHMKAHMKAGKTFQQAHAAAKKMGK